MQKKNSPIVLSFGHLKQIGGGEITEMENSFYGFLLRFITVCYGYYGIFRADLLRILNNITDITEIAITEYYGILQSVISPP